MKQIMGKIFHYEKEQLFNSDMKSEQMMGKVLNVLSYARDKYKNISIRNTLAALKPERLNMFSVIYIANKTLMRVTWLLAQEVSSLI